MFHVRGGTEEREGTIEIEGPLGNSGDYFHRAT